MGWGSGINAEGRKIGYAVKAKCDHKGCKARIHRGLSYVCGSMHEGGKHGCGGYFCEKHLPGFADEEQLCKQCTDNFYATHCENCEKEVETLIEGLCAECAGE